MTTATVIQKQENQQALSNVYAFGTPVTILQLYI